MSGLQRFASGAAVGLLGGPFRRGDRPEARIRLVDRRWRTELHDGLHRDATVLRIVCPFIKLAPLRDLLDEHEPAELLVVSRFNLADFGAGVSDIASLRRVLEAGGRVRGLRGLHAKLFLFGQTRAAITSANLTARGLGGNHEFGCVSEDPAFVKECSEYFERLWVAARQDLAVSELEAWEAELGRFLDRGGLPGAEEVLPDFGVDALGFEDAAPDLRPGPTGWVAESDQAFIKFFGEGSNRVGWSFSVLEEVRRSGCHWACTYPASKRPRAVGDGDTLFVGRLVKEPNDTLIFGRAIGREHRAGKDEASPAEIEARSWKAQWPNYVRVHHAEFVAGTVGNGVRLSELMDTLGSDSFASTQRNARLGNGQNTNPRKAFMQQPAVRLTGEAAAWMSDRLETALDVHGRISIADLDALDWP